MMRGYKTAVHDFPNNTIDSRVIAQCLNLQTPGSAYTGKRPSNDELSIQVRQHTACVDIRHL